MSIQNLSKNIWQVRTRKRINGKVVSRKKTINGSKSDAVIQEASFIKELNVLAQKESSLTFSTFGEVVDYYLNHTESDIKRVSCIFERLKNDLGNVKINQLTDRFDRYLQILRKEKSKTTGKSYSNATINRFISYAKACCNLSYRYEKINKNPLIRFSKLKEIARDRVLSKDEEKRFFTVIKNDVPHLYHAIYYAYLVPIRRSELINLKKENLDLENKVLRLRNGTTKNSRGGWKPIPSEMLDYFKNIPEESEHLFYRETSEGYKSLGDFKKSWKKILTLAKIEDFRFHDLRHISSTNLLDANTPERVIREIAGWSTDMLTRYYNITNKKVCEKVVFSNSVALACGPEQITSSINA